MHTHAHTCAYRHIHAHACLRRHVPTHDRSLSRARRRVRTMSHTHNPARHALLPALIAWDAATPKHIFQHTSYPNKIASQRVVEGLITKLISPSPLECSMIVSRINCFIPSPPPPLPSSPTGIRCAIDLWQQQQKQKRSEPDEVPCHCMFITAGPSTVVCR